MYPNLRFAFYDLFGIDFPFLGLVQTYGFFLALSFGIGAWWLYVEMRRRENLGLLTGFEEEIKIGEPLSIFSLISNALIGFLIGFKGIYALSNPDIFASDKAKSYLMSWEHGNWLMGIVLAIAFVAMKVYEKKKEKEKYPEPKTFKKIVMPHERIGDLVMLSAISGIFGAKLFYVLEEKPANEALLDAIFSGSGLTVYGGLIVAFFVVSYYVYKKKINYKQLLDVFAPGLILAYGVGRLGCHFSGDGDWGTTNPYPKPMAFLPDWMWAYHYPNNVINDGSAIVENCGGYPFADVYGHCSALAQGAYPTPVWEFLASIVIFFILFSLRKWAKEGGLLFAIYLIFNGLERFLIEIIRLNPEYDTVIGLQLSQAQHIAIVLFIIGIVLSLYLYNKQRKNLAH